MNKILFIQLTHLKADRNSAHEKFDWLSTYVYYYVALRVSKIQRRSISVFSRTGIDYSSDQHISVSLRDSPQLRAPPPHQHNHDQKTNHSHWDRTVKTCQDVSHQLVAFQHLSLIRVFYRVSLNGQNLSF